MIRKIVQICMAMLFIFSTGVQAAPDFLGNVGIFQPANQPEYEDGEGRGYGRGYGDGYGDGYGGGYPGYGYSGTL